MAGRLFFKQLKALLRKHLIVRRFYYIITSMELFAPLLIVGGVLVFFSVIDKSNSTASSSNSTLGPIVYPSPYRTIHFNADEDFLLPFKLFYSPKTVDKELVKLFSSSNNQMVVVRSFDNETQLDEAMKSEIQDFGLDYHSIIGVVFEEVDTNGRFNYTLKIPGSDLVNSILKSNTTFVKSIVLNVTYCFHCFRRIPH